MILRSVKKTYGEKIALDVPQLEIEPDKITAVLGESGAGKTTLLNVIAGALPFEGSVEGVGKVSYLFQSPTLLPNLTAEGNLKFVLPKEEWEKIPSMLEKVGLAGRGKSRPRELSGGERQRVAIARAFLYPHDVLLMDEPFSSLDLSLKKNLLSLTAELWKERRETVVFVTHDIHEAAILAHRALVLKEGVILRDLPIAGEPARDFFSRSAEEETLVRALTGEEFS